MVENIEQADGERVQKLSYILGIGKEKLEEIISYNQLVDHLEAAANEISDDLFKFRALIGHQGPLKPTDPNWKGSKYDVLVDWETGEKTYEPLSVLAADDPATCATYAKENDLLHIDGWKRFRNQAKRDKTLTRSVMQSRIWQVRRANKYMSGYLIPRSYKEALEYDKENNNTKWADAARDDDTIYIKTQDFRLLRYYSPAPRNIARRDWVTQNITHNMTSSIVQPYGPHSL